VRAHQQGRTLDLNQLLDQPAGSGRRTLQARSHGGAERHSVWDGR
jgi:hypothetical protein